jgi:hypothetical protein
MSKLDEARVEMHAFLADMESLKAFADPNGDESGKPLVDAFKAARERAIRAAQNYVTALANE